MAEHLSTLASFPDNSRVLIQGASRGIGLEFVRQALACANVARVFAACRRPGAAGPLQPLLAQHPERLLTVALDVSQEASVAAAFETVAAHTERLHLVINSAGILHDAGGLKPEKRLAEVTQENLQRSFAVNAFGPVLVAKHAYPLLRHRERAVLANISARVGSIEDNGLGGWYAYRAAKAAQNMFTKNLAIEFSRTAKNVLCVALHPGTTDTDLSAPFQGNVKAEKLFSTARAVRQLLAIIDGLTADDHGAFYAWDGRPIPW